jgi:dienelactone hydrolase
MRGRVDDPQGALRDYGYIPLNAYDCLVPQPRATSRRLSRHRLAATFLAMVLSGAAACSGSALPDHARIQVSAPTALADQAITIKVSGLAPGQQVTITSQASDGAHRIWRAHATFTAAQDGTVNLDTAAPSAGTYRGARGMGLFWSMTTLPTEDDSEYFEPPPPQVQASYPVRLTVTSQGRQLATRTVTRAWLAPGETAKTLASMGTKLSGVLFTPPPGTPRHPGVLTFGGSEGGMAQVWTAALLAAHGYPAVSVAYFNWPGRPKLLEQIPLEYFTAAGRLLARQPGTDPAHVLALGYSRGTEAALLLAEDFPKLFHGAIVYSPTAYVNPAEVDDTKPDWTLRGKPVRPGPIFLDRVSGPVLAFAGSDDTIWASGSAVQQIDTHLAGSKYPHPGIIYPAAGHGVGTFPYGPIGDGALQVAGGTRAGDVAAQVSGWAKLLAELASLG